MGGSTGVYGENSASSGSASAVLGIAYGSSGIGVNGHGLGYGVFGYGDNGVRGEGKYSTSAGVAGIGGSSGDGVYGSGSNHGIYSDGNFAASGTKSAVVALPDNRVVELYAMESPNNWFEDFGSADLSSGVAEVALDPTFALTVNTEMSYHIFLTPKGDCEGLYVAQQNARGFQIRELRGGKSNVTFDYRIVARRRGFESVRLQEVDADAEAVAAVREKNHARPGRPRINIPRKLAAAEALPAPSKTEGGSAVFRAPVLLEPMGQPTGPHLLPSVLGALGTGHASLGNPGTVPK